MKEHSVLVIISFPFLHPDHSQSFVIENNHIISFLYSVLNHNEYYHFDSLSFISPLKACSFVKTWKCARH